MATGARDYETDDLIIHWKPTLCIHSGICARGLPGVFKPKDRPWIQPENAPTEEIMAAIDRCPSGALSYDCKEV